MKQTITTEFIEKIIKKYESGKALTRKEQIFYRNIIGTLGCGYIFGFTDSELGEYVKCENDVIYFIERYCMIQTQDGIKDIKLYPHQKEIIEMYKTNRYNLIGLSRQIGFSTIIYLLYLHEMLFKPNSKILDISQRTDYHKIDKLRHTYIHLPYFLKKGIITWTTNLVEFENGSKLQLQPFTRIISKDYDKYHFNDAGYLHSGFAIAYDETLELVDKNLDKKLIISSLQNNKLFSETYEKSNRKNGDPENNNFVSTIFRWWEVPDRDNDWKNKEIINLGSFESFEREYNCKF